MLGDYAGRDVEVLVRERSGFRSVIAHCYGQLARDRDGDTLILRADGWRVTVNLIEVADLDWSDPDENPDLDDWLAFAARHLNVIVGLRT
ncbi:MAG: hypothetical protein ACRET5_17425 [Steroidobacteraceae bacterium]